MLTIGSAMTTCSSKSALTDVERDGLVTSCGSGLDDRKFVVAEVDGTDVAARVIRRWSPGARCHISRVAEQLATPTYESRISHMTQDEFNKATFAMMFGSAQERNEALAALTDMFLEYSNGTSQSTPTRLTSGEATALRARLRQVASCTCDLRGTSCPVHAKDASQ